jgi:chemosensory pili system protein ChpA (sensor histidine kinase/response regulator)
VSGSPHERESIEIFLREASEHLQYLREFSGILLEPHRQQEELNRLYISAHTLAGSSGSYGFPLFSEVAGKIAHVFQYALNAAIGPEIHGPLTEFLSDGIAVLEGDLLQINSDGKETAEDIAAFKQRYIFAFPRGSSADAEITSQQAGAEHRGAGGAGQSAEVNFDSLPADGDLPEEILEFFIPEAEEHLQIITECLLSLEGQANAADIHRLFRSIHTIKGSAAQVGLHRLSAIAHRVEDVIGRLRDGELEASPAIVDICLRSVDILKKFLHHEWTDQSEMREQTGNLLAHLSQFAPAAPKEEQEPGAVHDSPDAALPIATALAGAVAANGNGIAAPEPYETRRAPAATAAKSVRLSLERLDQMMNAVGELVINRTRMLGRLAELEKLVDILSFSKVRLSDKIADFEEKYEFTRLTGSYGAPAAPANFFSRGFAAPASSPGSSIGEFSELEMDRYDDFNILSRSLTEISADVTEVLTQLESFVGRVDSDIDEFTKLAHNLQDQITQARMVPIVNLYTRLTRTVRDAAKASGKQVELALSGADTDLDNNIIQQISDPLIHLVRNAVAHGIEKREDRLAAGKPAGGKVSVRAYHRGNHIYIEVEDDGRGVDYEQIRRSAVEGGFVPAEEAPRLSERELREFLFRPGFSTASQKNELAGRGVGLDVVRSNLTAMNGEVEIRSQLGAGTCFLLKVPLTLIISQALFVRCGNAQFAFPLASIEEIRRIRVEEIEEVGSQLLTRVRDVVTEVIRLDTQLGLPPLEPINGYYRMVIVNVAGRQMGVVVEEVLGKDEIVIKSLGEYLRNVKLFPGTTIASDGSLILLIDVHRLVAFATGEHRAVMPTATAARLFAPGAMAVAAGTIPSEAIDQVQNEKLVVVADDSISIRKFVGRLLEKAGYRVKLTSDGLEALEFATQNGCHLVITDLEMPRMNGYELMGLLRHGATTRNIPVLVVTSRAGAKHRERAVKEGAAGFLTKPVQEEQFLAAVAQMIAAGQAAGQDASPAHALAPVL